MGCTSQVDVYPLDLARRRNDAAACHPLDTQRLPGQLFQVLSELVRTCGGVRTAYSGVGVACFRVGAALGISMAVRDTVFGRLEHP